MQRDVVHKRDSWVTANDGSISGSASNGRLYFRPARVRARFGGHESPKPVAVEKCGPIPCTDHPHPVR